MPRKHKRNTELQARLKDCNELAAEIRELKRKLGEAELVFVLCVSNVRRMLGKA